MDVEKDIIWLYDFCKEDYVVVCVLKLMFVFKELDICGSLLGGFIDVEFFFDWCVIKKDIIDERKRWMSVLNEGVFG